MTHGELFHFLDALHEKGLIELHKIRWDWRRSLEECVGNRKMNKDNKPIQMAEMNSVDRREQTLNLLENDVNAHKTLSWAKIVKGKASEGEV